MLIDRFDASSLLQAYSGLQGAAVSSSSRGRKPSAAVYYSSWPHLSDSPPGLHRPRHMYLYGLKYIRDDDRLARGRGRGGAQQR